MLLDEPDSAFLSSRFRPEHRARIARDLGKENAILSLHIENGELDFWFKNLLTSAEKLTSRSTDHDTPQHACITRAEESLQESLSKQTENLIQKERIDWL